MKLCIIYCIYLIPIVFLILSRWLWHKFGRDDKVVETVEFYPPEGINSLDVGFLYRGKADKQSVMSLLIYLANKGYIKITETKEKSLYSVEDKIKITKLKEYDGSNVSEQIFFNGLFKKKTKLFAKCIGDSTVNEVTSDDLFNYFYLTINKVLSSIHHKENINKIFEKTSSNITSIIILMITATYCLITIPPFLEYGHRDTLILSLFIVGLCFAVPFNIIFSELETSHADHRQPFIGGILFFFIFGLLFGSISWITLVLPVLKENMVYFMGYILGVVCIFNIGICLRGLPKRTLYGNEMLGKLRGFRNFLLTAEKDKLEAMVMKDPMYFYNILPYAYALDVFDKWIEKFEDISLQAPSWYDSSQLFDAKTFLTFMNTTFLSARDVISMYID